MEHKKKLTKNQINALARGRAIRAQNIKNNSNNQSGGSIGLFFQKLDNFWEEADFKNPDSIYYPDTFNNRDWDNMVNWRSSSPPREGGLNWTCPQPWGFIFGAYKILTQDIEKVIPSRAARHMFDIDDICGDQYGPPPTQEEKQRYDAIISEFINDYLDNDKLYIGRKDNTPNYDTWGMYHEGINEVNMYDFFADFLEIDRTKVRHFLFKTLKEITTTRCRLITQARYGPDEYRNEEMPMFSDQMFAPTPRAPRGLLSVELNTIWDNLSNLTQWNGGGAVWDPGHEPRERQLRYIRLNARMIDMFEHIWERLIIPTMKKVIKDSSDPYSEFGIFRDVAVASSEGPQTTVPIEIIAEHERNILDKKYLDKWGPYGVKSVDKKTRETLDHWQQSYIDSYHKGVAPPAIWSEPPEPREVTRIKKSRERDAMRALKKRSGAAAGGESDYYSDTSSSDDEE